MGLRASQWEVTCSLLFLSYVGKPIALFATCFHAGYLFALFFDPEDGGDMFIRHVG
jgi:hypothetical protein